jgi:predicted  nucleic acid-binding Zn-ribbon protein
MAVTRQLFQLQELDTEIEQKELTLKQKQSQLGDRKVLDAAQQQLAVEQKRLDELKHQHREAEAEVTDLLTKIAEIERQLYGGRITNPKELASLQHEVSTMKAHSDALENTTLEIIDRVEEVERVVSTATNDLKKLEEDWQRQQQQLSEEIKSLIASLEELHKQRQELVGQIDAASVNLYEKIRKQKKQAVAKVEQGICRACRISLSASALQKARSGRPIQCGTCGRILYIS